MTSPNLQAVGLLISSKGTYNPASSYFPGDSVTFTPPGGTLGRYVAIANASAMCGGGGGGGGVATATNGGGSGAGGSNTGQSLGGGTGGSATANGLWPERWPCFDREVT